ncbi:MAG: response regulator [Deltaproteobacteria bacterium]|jgi:signal transduction histidine kinase/CheY-like chemotaxis protein|nr:response regulator [Deltaproteobacteria bacterium]
MKSLISSSFFRIAAFSSGLTVTPLICVLILVGLFRVEQAYDNVDAGMRNFMYSILRQQQEINTTTRTFLAGLASAREIRERDVPASVNLFRRLQAQVRTYNNIALYDQDGFLKGASVEGMSGAPKFMTRASLGGGSGDVARNRARRAAGSAPSAPLGQPDPPDQPDPAAANHGGIIITGAATQERFSAFFRDDSLVFIYPLYDSAGREEGFLAAFLNLEVQKEQLRRLDLPAGVVAYYLDAGGNPVFRYAPDPRFAEAPDNMGNFMQMDSVQGEGDILHVSENGKRYLFSYASVRLSSTTPYMYLALAAGEEYAYAPARSEFWRSFKLIALGALGMALLLWLLCLLVFKRPSARLLKVARRLGQGDFGARQALPVHAPGAFAGFSRSLYQMAEDLEVHEAEIREAGETAARAGRSKSEFLANMSHEIRTPLNAILGMTYLVLKSDLTLGQRGYVNKIQAASKNLLHVVNDILDFSKMEAGKLHIEQIRFSVRDLFGNLASHYNGRAQESGVHFEVSIAPDVPMYLVGDPLRLEQAISQLLDNAFRNTWRGTVRVSCALVSIVRSECLLRIMVSDTGEGMSPEELEDLRAAFAGKSQPESGGPQKKPAAGGMGSGAAGGPALGLAIAQRLFEIMNGAIEVDSEAGRGSVYTCTARFIYREADQTRKALVLAGKKVLIADSDEVSRLLYSSMLKNFSINASSVRSAGEAERELAAADAAGEPYDYFLLDWRNLEQDPVELLPRLRKELAASNRLKVLAISDAGRGELSKLAEAAGADAFLHKPMDASVLLDTMMGLHSGNEIASLGQAAARAARNVPKQTVEGLRALLVEDNLLNQQLAQEIMAYNGIKVSTAASGSQALRAIAESGQAFDVVLMDLQMPEMDGFEATWRIRHDAHLGSVYLPVIAMTAHSNPEEISACHKAGMDDYVAKPIDVNLFFEALARWLPTLPDRESLIRAEMLRLLDLAVNKDQSALALFANLQGVLQVFIGEGRLKKLQKMLWDNDWAEAGGFIRHLLAALYPDDNPAPGKPAGEGA